MADQRRDNVTREVLQRLVDEAAEKAGKTTGEASGKAAAMEILNSLSPHDLTKHEGRQAWLDDQKFLHGTRRRCDAVRERAFMGIATIGVPAVILTYWDSIGEIFKKALGK